MSVSSKISFNVQLSSNEEEEFFLHPKYIQMHEKDTSFSNVVMDNELIALKNSQTEYIEKVTTLKSNSHYLFKFDLYIYVDMIEEYELISNFISPSIYVSTNDQFYWICCNECRSFCGLTTYNKIDDAVFRLIAAFCAEFGFHGTSDQMQISDNLLTVEIPNKMSERMEDDYIAVLFGNFLYSKDERKFRAIIKLEHISDDDKKEGFGVGFAEPMFEDFDSNYDPYLEHAFLIYNNRVKSTWHEFILVGESRVLLKSGMQITVIIDMKNKIGTICLDDTTLLKVKLPKYVAIVTSFNSSKQQKITVSECGFVI